ncbi:glycosyltransferase [Desulfuromonas sp. TF]|uniref:glycosyltransferase n=1 Tax=Desulfuromonas sp. TF TaxID=1232410 RepID=UPI0003FC880F|nr:glycosyltransferase [Desulfuromonas sp. TF]
MTDLRWANWRDMELPLWRQWNSRNPLPPNFWQRIWEYPYLVSRVPAATHCLDVGGTYPFVLFKSFPAACSVDCRDLNRLDHPLHHQKWPDGRLIISDATAIPLEDDAFPYTFSISAIEEMPDPIAVLREMLRLARHRVVVTMDVSENLGLSRTQTRELEQFLGVTIPSLPNDSLTSVDPQLARFGQRQTDVYRHIRVLGMTLDARDEPKSMAILLPHWESWTFLRPCLERMQARRNKNLDERIYVLDDASGDGSYEKARAYFAGDERIIFNRFERPNKNHDADVGLLLDYGLDLVQEQYVAMTDADAMPLIDEWLSFPIWLIEKYGCSSVGLDTGLSTGYARRDTARNWWQPATGYTPSAGLYDNESFTCTNNLYRVMPTALARVASEQIGFTRATPGGEMPIGDRLRRRLRRMRGLPEPNPRHPYLPGGCDNGVAANHFLDINHMGPKFNLPLTSYIGLTPKDGAFGQNICGLLFHFALSTRALSRERREVCDPGGSFNYWVDQLQRAADGDSQVINDMIAASSRFQPGGYDRSVPKAWYEKEFEIIQKLLQQFRDEQRETV